MISLAIRQLINQAQADIDLADRLADAEGQIEGLERMTIAMRMACDATDYLRSFQKTQKRKQS